ncbi:VCBS repeat-containing protein [Rhizobium sp. PP-CC-3A-592]|nr:VCBS repeat-containing protein [Rhizobium sp. PP-CC-3A-592]
MLLNIGNFTDTYDFQIADGVTSDATFNVNVGGLVGVLTNATASLEVNVNGTWTEVGNSSSGGLLDLIGLAGQGVQITASDLEAGAYRLTFSGGGLVGAVTTIDLDANFVDSSLTDFVGVSGPAATGNLLTDAGPGGGQDVLGPDGLAVLQILDGNGTFVTVTDGTIVAGEHGTLVINSDGSYSYEANDNPTAVGQVDDFQYRLLHPNGDSDTANLFVRIESPDATTIWSSADLAADATVMTAVNDIDQAFVSRAFLETSSFVDNAIDYTRGLFGTTGNTTYDFSVAEDTQADLSLDVSSSALLNLLDTLSFNLYEIVGGNPVLVGTSGSGGLIDLVGLSGSSIRAMIDGLDSGTYRLEVNNSGISLGTRITADATFQTTDFTEFVPGTVIAAQGNILDGSESGGQADTLGSDLTSLSVLDGNGFVLPDADGQVIVGDYGSLTIFANGDYYYEPVPSLASIGQTDTFTYQLLHPNGSTQVAELAIVIGDPDVDPSAVETSNMGARLFGDSEDVIALDSLVATNVDDDLGAVSTTLDNHLDLTLDNILESGEDGPLTIDLGDGDETNPSVSDDQYVSIDYDPPVYSTVDPLVHDDALHQASAL